MRVEPLFGINGPLLFVMHMCKLSLGGAVILHQRNMAGTHIGAGAAFDAVEQVVRLELFVLLAQGEEVQLLRQQVAIRSR